MSFMTIFKSRRFIIIIIFYFLTLFFYIFPIIYDEFILMLERRRIYIFGYYTFCYQIFHLTISSIEKSNTECVYFSVLIS